jgi:glycosyltransferase involved in cell wall biosynthesis
LGNHLYQLRALWIELILPFLVRREKIDILYTTIPNGLSCVSVPHVVTVHDLIPLVYPSDAPRTVTWNFRYRLPKILNNAVTIVAVSEYTRLDVLRYFNIPPNKVVTVLEGYDQALFRPAENQAVLKKYGLNGHRYVCYVGNASARKNLPLLLQAFAAIEKMYPHRLLLVGSKSTVELLQLKREIARLGIYDKVIMVEYVPVTDLPILYSGADLFLFLSLYEGFGLPVLEAMACGTPVLASSTTSVPEVTGAAAVLVDPTDLTSITDSLKALLQDRERLNSMALLGLERSKMFTWAGAARRILEILSDNYSK